MDTVFDRLYHEVHGELGYHVDLKHIKVEDAEARTAICQGNREEQDEELAQDGNADLPTVSRSTRSSLPPLQILRGGMNRSSEEDDIDHPSASISQLVQVSIRPMDRRTVLIKLPVDFSLTDVFDYVVPTDSTTAPPNA